MKMNKIMSIRSYILVLTLAHTLGFVGSALLLLFVGGKLLSLGYREVLIFLLFLYPFAVSSAIYGFYKGLVRHYGFQGKERLFPFDIA
jgi:hypothetical protein